MLRYTFLLLLITRQFSIQKALDARGTGEGKGGRKVSFPNPQQLNTLYVDYWKTLRLVTYTFQESICRFSCRDWVYWVRRFSQSQIISRQNQINWRLAVAQQVWQKWFRGVVIAGVPSLSPWSLSHTSLPDVLLSGSLSNDVFEPRTSTWSGVTLTIFSCKSSLREKRH